MDVIATRPGERAACRCELPDPEVPLPSGSVLCRTLEVGVCGTDREIIGTGKPSVPPGEEFLVLGHECLARIEEVAEDVVDLAPGDLVVPLVRRLIDGADPRPDLAAPEAYVERGIFYEHGFASSHWIDRTEYLLSVPPPLAAVAVLTEPLSIGEKAVNEALALQRGRLGPEAWRASPPRVLVTGMGPIAVLAALACRAREWPVTLCGRDDEQSDRVRVAARLGASYSRFSPSGKVPGESFDLVLECTGSEAVLLEAARRLGPCGVMAWLGSSFEPRPATWNLARLMEDAIVGNQVHFGSVNAAPRDFRDALRHLEEFHRRSPEAVAGVITHRVAAGDDAALDYFARRPGGAIKVVIDYRLSN